MDVASVADEVIVVVAVDAPIAAAVVVAVSVLAVVVLAGVVKANRHHRYYVRDLLPVLSIRLRSDAFGLGCCYSFSPRYWISS